MPLDLESHQAIPQSFTGGISVDNLSWWFWMKAGMGFTLGAGIVYATGTIVWLMMLSRAPGLIWLRMVARY